MAQRADPGQVVSTHVLNSIEDYPVNLMIELFAPEFLYPHYSEASATTFFNQDLGFCFYCYSSVYFIHTSCCLLLIKSHTDY